MKNKVLIKEIFESVQGEGPYVGFNQLFIRFSKCNLNCRYCDTDFTSELKEYSIEDLLMVINKYQNIHSISLTGAEPLMESDFLKEFLPLVNKKIYLETNGTLPDELLKIVNHVDIVSMDLKLPSCSKMRDFYKEHEQFIYIAHKFGKEIFLKIVFDENIQDEEIEKTSVIASKFNDLVILQPKTDKEKLNLDSDIISKVYYKYLKSYPNVRLIPQMHKFLNLV